MRGKLGVAIAKIHYKNFQRINKIFKNRNVRSETIEVDCVRQKIY